MDHQEKWLNHIHEALTGEITAKRQHALDEWLNASDENRHYYEAVKRLWEAADAATEDKRFDPSTAYNNFCTKTRGSVTGWQSLLRYTGAAAALILVTLASSYWLWQRPEAAPAVATITVPRGSTSKTVLQDGTVVWLNAATEIRLGDNFGKRERRIKLQGEAYFEVVKNTDVPFIVETEAMEIKVHGTSFNVKSYPDDAQVSVALVEGAVELQTKAGQPLHLRPDQLAIYDIRQRQYTILPNASEYGTDWVNNRLIFKNAELKTIIHDLERMFGADITIHREALEKRKFTGDFTKGETLEEILKIMASLEAFTYRIEGRKVAIY
ncbi:ferric-dicitrate binding protein FerR, regulates iron transport through sigma-19 [Parapedobacter composti]|uniref:Ferric-dicitrate binding protein FerR, regulates iron transport through sigma-19 n=1 Tax=Parapedobacter composti TaxID=623281 RepID=A0A1I1IUV5_9SPHI|nr:FecR domain-containing protein [Parapedobacter composti]SFC39691.1 ferric-dicitrate binding protein FerR, regulates iron transport through sigma-19 [Parapedobacter composti]